MAEMELTMVPATPAHLLKMMQWFLEPKSVTEWGGPEFRFPLTPVTFLADSKLESVPSYVLIGDSAQLLGFGQYYLRAGRCHLARLAVAPSFRGQGLGTCLIKMLMAEGTRTLKVTECSLFVHVANTAALALYERLGFATVPYPEATSAIPDSHYMVTS